MASSHVPRRQGKGFPAILCIVLCLGLAAFPRSLHAQGKLDGTYTMNGTALDGKEFKGEFSLSAEKDVYHYSSQDSQGYALLKGNILAIAYGGAECGVALYGVAPDGSLNGAWATAGSAYAGTERALPDGGTSSRSNYQLTGTYPDGNPYRGILRISQDNAVFNLTWVAPSTVNGVGIVANGYLGATYGGANCGLMLYQVQSDGSLSGQWTSQGQNSVGTVQAAIKGSETDSGLGENGEGNASESTDSGSSNDSQALAVDNEAQVTEAGNELYVLNAPEVGAKRVSVLLTGNLVLLLDGPLVHDGYTWWQVKALDGHTGYVMEGFKDIAWITSATGDQKMNAEIPESTLYMGARCTLADGSKLVVTVRDQPLRDAQAIKRIENNSQIVVIIGGPVIAEERRWWQVRLGADSGADAADERTGWIAEDTEAFLKPLQAPDEVLTVKGGGIEVGANVRVTGSGGELLMHQDPDVKTTPISMLAQAADATIISGPVQAQGFTWWEVKRVSDGIRGWIAVAPGWLENYNG